MGYAFTYLIVSLLARIPIGAYVHYPTISTDMLARVRSRKAWHTNANHISRSALLSHLKLMQVDLLSAHHNAITYLACYPVFFTDRYYRIFMYHYAISLRAASILMVNSTWTKNHVDAILCHSDFLLDLTYLTPPFLFLKLFFTRNNAPDESMIVYPTREMERFSLYHALTPATFASTMHEILTLSPEQQLAMRSRGRNLYDDSPKISLSRIGADGGDI